MMRITLHNSIKTKLTLTSSPNNLDVRLLHYHNSHLSLHYVSHPLWWTLCAGFLPHLFLPLSRLHHANVWNPRELQHPLKDNCFFSIKARLLLYMYHFSFTSHLGAWTTANTNSYESLLSMKKQTLRLHCQCKCHNKITNTCKWGKHVIWIAVRLLHSYTCHLWLFIYCTL